MPSKSTSRAQLLAENEELRARLEKAEATLSEMLGGDADALLIPGVDGAQLFTLKGSDQSYRALVENMSEGALTLSPDGLVLYANRRFAEIIGTPLEKVIGSDILDWCSPGSRSVLQAILQALLQKDVLDMHREELLFAGTDGRQVPVYISVNHLVIDEIESVWMVVTDLTEQKRNEAILAAEKLSNAILEQAADAIVICDETGRVMRASKQARALCDKSPLGQKFEQAFPLCYPDGAAFPVIGTVDTNRQLSAEARLTNNENWFDLLVSVGHLKDAEGRLLGSLITLTDVTEYKKAKDKLLDAKNFLQLVIDTVPYRIFWKDNDLRYLGCNTRFANDAGLTSSSELIGKTDFDLPWKDHQAKAYRKDDKAVMKSGTPKLDIEEPQTRPDGNTIWLNTSKVPLRDKEDQIIGVLGLYIDITERIKVKQELHESERRFRTMFEQAPLGIALIDSNNGSICQVNQRFAEIAGRSMEEMQNIDWMKITHPDDVQDDLDNMAMMNAGKIAGFQMEKRYLYPDGTGVWIDMTIAPLKIKDKSHPRHLCMIQDITERKQAEVELLERKQEFQTLTEALPQIVWMTRADGWNTYFNQHWMEYTGLSLEESLGHGWNIPFHPDDQQRAWNAWSHAVSTIGTYSIESRLRRFDGEYRWWLIRGVPMQDADGNILKWFGTCTDIHDLKMAETEITRANDKLRESERRFTNMLENVELVSVMIDREMRVTYCNDYLLNLTGWQREEVIGENWLDMFIPPEEKELVAEIHKNLLAEDPDAIHHENEIHSRTGERRLIRWNNSVLHSEKGEVIGAASIGEDITERKQAEQKFKDLLESAPDAMVIVNRNAEMVLVNARAESLFGWYREDLLGQKIDMLVPERFRAKQPEYQDGYFSESHPRPMGVDQFALHKSGSEIPVEISLSPLETNEGNLAIAAIRDITERKQSEEKITALALRYQALMATSLDGIHVMDEQGNIIEANDAFCAMLGYTQDEVAHLNVADWDAKWSARELQKILTELIGRSELFETVHRRKDGGLINVEISASGVMLNGRYYIFSASRNITDQKKAEVSIKYLNRVYAMLSEISALIVRVRDRNELFKEACRVAVEVGGFRMAMMFMEDRGLMKVVPMASMGKGEALPKLVNKVLSSTELAEKTMIARAIREKRAIVSNEVQGDPQVLFSQEYIKAGVSSIVVLPLIIANEAIGAFALYASENNFFHDDELALLTKLVDDIVFAKGYLRAQQALHQLTEELEDKVAARTADLEQARQESDRANQAKSTFLAAMSHEIRTPMNGVIGMIEVLRQTSLKEHQLEMVDLVNESAVSLLEIIEDILNFSKIEAGKLEIEQVPISLLDVAEKACDLMDHMATRKGVEFTMFIDPALPEEVLGDALRLRQVLVNLISNAIKFCSGQQRQGKVSLRALLAAHASEQVTVEFQVIDNGIGMDEASQAQLFTAFTQADTTTTRRFGGTGLGLVISRDLVELMGGEIMVQSAPDQGATFTVRLPFMPLPGKQLEGDRRVDLSGLSCIVMGNQGFADDMAAYLTYAGAVVERPKDLAAATKLISTAPIGLWLIIIDARDDTEPVEELRTACLARDNALDSRFVVVEHGHHQPGMEPHFVVVKRGRRRHGRIQSVDLVSIDGDVMHRQSFLEAVAIAAGRAQEINEISSRPAEFDKNRVPSREQARQQGRLILVAEDNETNQKVIQHQLGLLGFAADVSSDGSQALECWESGDYGFLLTDLNMPKMDGYQLTAAIRTKEAGMRRTPIVALTANAITDEAEHCRAAGMDDYLSKPVRLEELRDMLEKWLPDAVDVKAYTANSQSTSAASNVPVDIRIFQSVVGDDPAVINELLRDFQTSATKIAAELLAACTAGNAAAAGAAAHKLKSSAFSVGAQSLGELCVKIEQAGKAGQVDALLALQPRFEAEMAVVNEFLETL